MRERLAVELLDAFGTVVAAGHITVNGDAITPAELVEYDQAGVMTARVVTGGRRARLADMPLLQLCAEGDYVHCQPPNPNLPWQVRVRLAT